VYDSILVDESDLSLRITINRPQKKNAINESLLHEINWALDMAESKASCKIVILQGQSGVFCTGMDFELLQTSPLPSAIESTSEDPLARLYQETLQRFTRTRRVIVTLVDGQVIGGGVGLVAASDLVLATNRCFFSLSEALWGLLPAVVTPYLIRRVGYQLAYRMALTTIPISAQEAHARQLVDVLTEELESTLHQYVLRLARIEENTVGDIKDYFQKMWLLTPEMEDIAVREISRLAASPKVIKNISNFVAHQRFPWDDF